MRKAKRALLIIAGFILGCLMGFAISAIQYRIDVVEAPLVASIEGDFGSTVTANVEGHVNFRDGEDLVAATVTVEDEGNGRVIEPGQQIFARVTTFHVDAEGRATSIDETEILGSATSETLGENEPYIIGEAEGSRIVVVLPETARTGLIRVIDVLPTVLRGEHGIVDARDGLPSISSGEDGIPVVESGGGQIAAFADNVIISGYGQQIEPSDSVIINYMIVAPNGSVIESTWNNPQPTVLNVDEVFSGLHTALVDSRVGTRMVVAVPAALAQGEDDVALVIDVLGKLRAES